MTENRANSGVRNLRAMFENPSAASSPEPRGRSPVGRINADGNRPTSKVRASFVSVEPNSHVSKDLGTTKGTPEGINSSLANRRGSFSISEDKGDDTVTTLKKVVSHEKEARKNSQDIGEPIPEQAVETRESSRAAPPIRETEDNMPNLGSIMKGSDFPEPQTAAEEQPKASASVQAAGKQNASAEKLEDKLAALSLKDSSAENSDKLVSGVQEEASLKLADPKDEATVSNGQALPPPTEVVPSTKAVTNTPAKSKINGNSSTPATNGTSSAAKKPSAISTAKASMAKSTSAKSPLPKSPGVARLPKTPTTPKPAAASASTKSPAPAKEPTKMQPRATANKESAKVPAPKASRASLRPSLTAPTASAAAKTKAPAVENKKPTTKTTTTAAAPASKDTASTSPGGFKKPRPKSPTRPVRLPSHLTAPTASSAAKFGEDGTQKSSRGASTGSRPSLSKAVPAAKKQPSPASLAPSTAPAKRPGSRASTVGPADEGFLARMMRPTASSSSKTHEKPASPPRRGPSVKGPAKAKPNQGTVMKGKETVKEVVTKAKDAITSDSHSEEHQTETVDPETSNTTAGAVAEESAKPTEPVQESTPMEQAEPSAVELQTPDSEGQATH